MAVAVLIRGAILNRRHDGIVEELQVIRKCFVSFERSLRRRAPLVPLVIQNGRKAGKQRSHPRLSTKARASLVLQGRYTGYVRQLKPRQKVQVRKLRQAKGVRTAILKAREMAAP